jgi:hypothetical protein
MELPMLETSANVRNPASYRDPSGFVFRRHGCVLRQINPCYRSDYDHLIASGLYQQLTDAGMLLPHEEAPLDWRLDERAYKVLRPVQLPFVSYPYEWSFSQLRDAALLTLKIQSLALAKGMSLKDASAYNIQLFGGRPMLIDTLSFERYDEGLPWVAYRQFCQHFLAPLALMSRTDVRLSQLLRVYIDGVPLDLAGRLLPWRTKFSLSLGIHIHAHARCQQKHAHSAGGKNTKATFSRRQFETILAGLESAVSGLRWNTGYTEWADYYAANNNYGDTGLETKERLVKQLLERIQPRIVWDLGANDGRFSRIAAKCGAETVVAWDIDPTCVEHNYRHLIAQRETSLHPLLLDLTNPSPGVGWGNVERASFAARGPADAILALGLIHHLAISNNVPLAQLAETFAALGKCLIVEWVPKEDSQVQKLLTTRKDIFPSYVQNEFEQAFQQRYAIESRLPVDGTKRTLYLMQIRN